MHEICKSKCSKTLEKHIKNALKHLKSVKYRALKHLKSVKYRTLKHLKSVKYREFSVKYREFKLPVFFTFQVF